MNPLYLLGTNHWDLKGSERLRKFLGIVRPATIGVEASEELIKLRLSEREFFKKEIKKQQQFDQMLEELYSTIGKEAPQDGNKMVLGFFATQGYEIWSSYEYQEEDNPAAQIFPVHIHEVLVRRSLEGYKKGFGEEDGDSQGDLAPHFLGEAGEMDPVEFQKKVNSSYFELGEIEEASQSPQFLAFIRECDDVMEPKIRDVVSKNINGGATVIIAGNTHFFAGYGNNLYERLRDLSPIRVRLPEVDKF